MQTKSDNAVTIDKVALMQEEEQSRLSPYMMFKYSSRSELTRKYYERRLRGFFDYTQFETGVKDMEKRWNDFAESARNNSNWMLNQIVRFLHFQKQRVENEEIAAETLKNFCRIIENIFCDSADLDVPWKKVTRGLPESHPIMIAVLVDCFSIVHSIPRFLVDYIALQFLDLLFLRFVVRT